MSNIPDNFSCPRCGARYAVIAVPGEANATVACVVCREEMPPRTDGSILKYFLIRKAERRLAS